MPIPRSLYRLGSQVLGRIYAPRLESSYLVASLGRSGSRMVVDAEIDCIGQNVMSFYDPRFRGVFIRSAWTLGDLNAKPGYVYKTHDFPNALQAPDHLRVVYIFADPIDIVRSMLSCEQRYGPDWVRTAFERSKANFDDFGGILDKDALRIEEHFDAWYGHQSFQLLTVKLEALWDHEAQLREYLGLDLVLPERRRRAAMDIEFSAGEQARFDKTYSALRQKIAASEAFKIWPAITGKNPAAAPSQGG